MTEEDRLQITVAQYLDLRGYDWFHVPNGGSRNVIEATKLKRMGTKRGIPDIIILATPRNVAIELKAIKGKLSPFQKEWRERFTAKGWAWSECRSLEDVRDTLRKCGLE